MKSNKELNKHNRSTKAASIKASKIDRNYFVALFLILLGTLIIYTPILHNGFVWDDDAYVRNNPLIQSIDINYIFTKFEMGNYHLITMLVC